MNNELYLKIGKTFLQVLDGLFTTEELQAMNDNPDDVEQAYLDALGEVMEATATRNRDASYYTPNYLIEAAKKLEEHLEK